MSPILIISFLGLVVSSAILAYGFIGNGNYYDLHLGHLSNIQPTEASNLEHKLDIELLGSTQTSNPNLVIDTEYIDSTIGCEFCTRIEYTPFEKQASGIAFKNSDLDLTGYQRLVFFARAEKPLNVTFLAIGTNSRNSDTLVFHNEKFAIVTKGMIPDDSWKRFEISLSKYNLNGITIPFGLFLSGHNSDSNQVVYLKGITLDRKQAQDSIPLV